MQDTQIINELFERNENILGDISEKFGKLCLQISYNILNNREDAEECVNDTYLNVWNSIPPVPTTSARMYAR